MDDRSDEPQEVAEDIIKQATTFGFRQEATIRIVQILKSYKEPRENIAKLAEQLQTESEVSCDGYLAWREAEGQIDGPFCALCYNGQKGLFRLIERKGTGWWECPSCEKRVQESAYRKKEEELNTAKDRVQIYLREKLKRLSFDAVRQKIDKSYTDLFLEDLIKKYPNVFRECEIKISQGMKRAIRLTRR